MLPLAGFYAGQPEAHAQRPRSERMATILVLPLGILLTLLVVIFFVLFERATVSGPSMLPTLHNGDYILISRGLPAPAREDVIALNIVFRGVEQTWVKRIVALPGDVVDVRGDIITVNGVPDAHSPPAATAYTAWPLEHLTVPAGQVFVAGDNRAVSEDSRFVGPIPEASIRGRIVAVYAPIQRFAILPNP